MNNKEEFARENIGLIYQFIKTYNIGKHCDKVMDILYIGFTKAINKYDESKGQFSTFAFFCMKSEYLNYLEKYKRQMKYLAGPIISLNSYVNDEEESELIDFIEDKNTNIEKEVLGNIFTEECENIMSNILTMSQMQVFKLYYLEDKNISEIAQSLNVSKQLINGLKNEALLKLQNYFNKRDFNYKVTNKKEFEDMKGYMTYIKHNTKFSLDNNQSIEDELRNMLV